jgi:hypothetical protein
MIAPSKMKKAYGQLYEIETTMRSCIRKNMAEEYDPNWYYTSARYAGLQKLPRRPFEKLHLYELEKYFHIYPCFSFPQKFFKKLHILYPIRNKIAHCRDLTNEEVSQLEEIHHYVLQILDNLNKKETKSVNRKVNLEKINDCVKKKG